MARIIKTTHCLAWLMLSLLTACSSTPNPTYINLTISADADLNPDLASRPSPLVLKLVEMKAHTAFSNADYFKLSANSKSTLGPDFMADETMPIRPGEIKRLKLKLHERSKYLGVVAGYRDIEKAKWRYIFKPELETLSDINLVLMRNGIRSLSADDLDKKTKEEDEKSLNLESVKSAASQAKDGYDTVEDVSQNSHVGNVINSKPSFKLDNF